MRIQLTPMTEDECGNYLETLIPDYARENVAAGYWDESEAVEKSRETITNLLLEGVKTPDHHLFIVCDGEQRVGVAWMGVTFDRPIKSGFIFDIIIDDAQRGKGYGKQAMLLLEEKGRELGLSKLGLHVFGQNQVARGLYEKLGYEVSSLNMTKGIT